MRLRPRKHPYQKPKSRQKLGDEQFTLFRSKNPHDKYPWILSKKEARDVAKGMRKQGRKARVRPLGKTQGPSGSYGVFFRGK